MKVEFFLDSGANIHSCNKTGELDTVEDLGLEEGEWEQMSETERDAKVLDYFMGQGMLEYYYEEC